MYCLGSPKSYHLYYYVMIKLHQSINIYWQKDRFFNNRPNFICILFTLFYFYVIKHSSSSHLFDILCVRVISFVATFQMYLLKTFLGALSLIVQKTNLVLPNLFGLFILTECTFILHTSIILCCYILNDHRKI